MIETKDYKKNTIASATGEQLVILVFEGLLSSLKKSRIYLQEKTSFNGIGYIEAAHLELVKSRELLYELLTSLDFQKGGELAEHLKKVYLYLLDIITEADFTKDIDTIDLACNGVVPLLEAFRETTKGKRGTVPRKRLEVIG